MSNIASYELFKASLTSLPTSQYLIPDINHGWHESAVDQLNCLSKLKAGWDGYQAPPILFENAYFTIQILQSICRDYTLPPQIVPGVAGDLQIEWHTLQGDLELHVLAPNHVIAYYSNIGNYPNEAELVLTFDFTAIAAWIDQLMETPIATVAATA